MADLSDLVGGAGVRLGISVQMDRRLILTLVGEDWTIYWAQYLGSKVEELEGQREGRIIKRRLHWILRRRYSGQRSL